MIGLVVEAIRNSESRATGGPPAESLHVHLVAAGHERHQARHVVVGHVSLRGGPDRVQPAAAEVACHSA